MDANTINSFIHSKQKKVKKKKKEELTDIHDNIFYIYPQSSRTEFCNKSIAAELIVL